MSLPEYKECPACAEDIKLPARVCRFCGAILTSDPLPTFLPRNVLELYNQHCADGEHAPKLSVQIPEADLLAASHRQKFEALLTESPDQIRSASMLFVDINGYTALCERRSVEQVKHILDAYYTVCTQVTELYNGFVVKFQGDGCIAAFGAPMAYERDAEAAVRAAIEIRDRVRLFPLMYGEKIRVSAGAETGPILTSVIKTGTKSYDIFGKAVNLAARIQGIAEPDTVFIGPATYALAGSAFRLHRNPPVKLKNVEGEVVTYRVLGAKRPNALLPDRSIPFCGRASETSALQTAWKSFSSEPWPGAACGACLVGEAGIGKSRLAAEFIKLLNDSAQLVTINVLPHWKNVPWNLWKGFLSSRFNIADGGKPAAVKKQLLDGLSEIGYSDISDPATFLALLGNQAALKRLESLSAGVLKRTFAVDLRTLLEKAAESRPILIFIDDIHWADATSLELLNSLLQDPPANLFFLLTSRPVENVAESLPAGVHRIAVENLCGDELEQFTQSVCRTLRTAAEVSEEIGRRAPGNPLHLIELARACHELLSKADTPTKRDQFRRQLGTLLPLSIREVVQARIDSLDQQSRQVLQNASVLGQRFNLSVIDLLRPVPDGLVARLYSLKAQNLLCDRTTPEGMEFYFESALVREVVYQGLLDDQRREMHGTAGEKLEKSFGNKAMDHAYTLAYHYKFSNYPEKALLYLKESGDRSASTGAPPEAIDYYADALEAIGKTHDPTRHRRIQASILRSRGKMQYVSGAPGDAIESFRCGIELSADSRDQSMVAWMELETGYSYWLMSAVDQAEAALARAFKKAGKKNDAKFQSLGWNRLGMCALSRGDLEEAKQRFERAIKCSETCNDKVLEAEAHNNLALVLWRLGNLNQAALEFGRAVDIFLLIENHYGTATAMNNRAMIHEAMAEFDLAEEGYTQALKTAEKIRFMQVVSAAHGNLSNLCLTHSDFERATSHAAQSLAIAQKIGDQRSAAIAMENLALAAIGLRDFSASRKWLKEAGSIAAAIGDAERTFSLRLVDLELRIATGSAVTAMKGIETARLELSQNRFAAELPRLLRLETHGNFACGRIPAAVKCAAEALAEAGRQQNHAECLRIEKLQEIYQGNASDDKDRIHLVKYRSEWPRLFEREQKLLLQALKMPCQIHHVGSTAVPGLTAKPLIDIMVAVDELSPCPDFEDLLRPLGYVHQSIQDRDRYCFRKGMPRTHHVHIVERNSRHYFAMILFRDYLRTHGDTLAEYAELKQGLAQECGETRELYTERKGPFILSILQKLFAASPELRERFNDPRALFNQELSVKL